uniref:(California timema) hypothetical protein n=1 Tax=Timema californicum TaxID=61474 RepID=A0A7R9PB30_TIMCA|nr:unnamed protein product [Timema californicum]
MSCYLLLLWLLLEIPLDTGSRADEMGNGRAMENSRPECRLRRSCPVSLRGDACCIKQGAMNKATTRQHDLGFKNPDIKFEQVYWRDVRRHEHHKCDPTLWQLCWRRVDRFKSGAMTTDVGGNNTGRVPSQESAMGCMQDRGCAEQKVFRLAVPYSPRGGYSVFPLKIRPETLANVPVDLDERVERGVPYGGHGVTQQLHDGGDETGDRQRKEQNVANSLLECSLQAVHHFLTYLAVFVRERGHQLVEQRLWGDDVPFHQFEDQQLRFLTHHLLAVPWKQSMNIKKFPAVGVSLSLTESVDDGWQHCRNVRPEVHPHPVHQVPEPRTHELERKKRHAPCYAQQTTTERVTPPPLTPPHHPTTPTRDFRRSSRQKSDVSCQSAPKKPRGYLLYILDIEITSCSVPVIGTWKETPPSVDLTGDSNPDHPVIGSLAYCESSAFDHVSTEAEDSLPYREFRPSSYKGKRKVVHLLSRRNSGVDTKRHVYLGRFNNGCARKLPRKRELAHLCRCNKRL